MFQTESMNEFMSNIQKIFSNKQHRVLNVYCTAGYPSLESTLEVVEALTNAGADLIEIGMPYSDPLADGQVIQESSAVALQNGMTIAVLLQQLKNYRAAGKHHAPIILMGYMNPVLQYGFESFCADAAAAGVSGLILPDLPAYEFETEFGAIIRKNGLDFIFLVTPETSLERVRMLDNLSSGFLYAVSSSSTTGNEKDFAAVEQYLQRLQSLQLANPVLVGFGIKDRNTFESACKYANGAIIGTAYIKALTASKDIVATTNQFLSGILATD